MITVHVSHIFPVFLLSVLHDSTIFILPLIKLASSTIIRCTVRYFQYLDIGKLNNSSTSYLEVNTKHHKSISTIQNDENFRLLSKTASDFAYYSSIQTHSFWLFVFISSIAKPTKTQYAVPLIVIIIMA